MQVFEVTIYSQEGPTSLPRVTIFPSYMLFYIGFAMTHPEFGRWFAGAIAACLIVLGIVAVPLNLRLSRKYQRQIDELDALPKTWNTP